MKKLVSLLLVISLFSCRKSKMEVPKRKALLQECYLDTLPH